MAGARKLQAEVDRTLKAIGEHLVEFESIWDKVVNAATQSLKEKYENDLKKEIKKLQRMRDSLKVFIQSNEIKMKKPLLDARKVIEGKMEQFKVLERETKTKAYSREGLNQTTPKRNWNATPGSEPGTEEERREDVLSWLDGTIDVLQSQMDDAEEKIEAAKAAAPVAKSKKGKKNDAGSINNEAQRVMERHAWHIARLNQIKEAVENGDEFLELDAIDDIKDDVEFYVNNNQEPDFNEDESIYDALSLDEQHAVTDSAQVEDANGVSGEDEAEKDSEVGDDDESKGATSPSKAKQAAAKVAAAASARIAAATAVAATNKTPAATVVPATKPERTAVPAAPAATAPPRPTVNVAAPAPKPTASQASPSAPSAASIVSAKKAAPAPAPPQPAKPMESLASIVMKSKAAAASTPAPTPTPVIAATAAAPPILAAKPPTTHATAAAPSAAKPAATAAPATTAPLPAPSASSAVAVRSTQPLPNTTSVTSKPAATAPTQPMQPPQTTAQPAAALPQYPHPSSSLSGVEEPVAAPMPAPVQAPVAAPFQSSVSVQQQQQQQPQPPSHHAFASAALMKDRSEYFSTRSSIDVSLKSFPQSVDSDRVKTYIPRNPYRTPPFFQLHPAPIFDDASLFDKFGLDTLFFIFYFQQGTPHQYLAARELKKQSWRYHKNFLTWFQRHEEPKLTTEEFEQGTYVYFDYESGWCQRIKQEFTFEYRHLEDELTIITPTTPATAQQQQANNM